QQSQPARQGVELGRAPLCGRGCVSRAGHLGHARRGHGGARSRAVIIKGGSRSGGAALGQYLVKEGANERATVLEIRGTVAKDLVGALKEMEAYGEGTKSEKPLYHAMISPEPPYRLSPEQVFQSVDRLEEEL